MPSKYELPPKTMGVVNGLTARREQLRRDLENFCINGQNFCYDIPRARDFVRTHACDIYDLLEHAYKSKVDTYRWAPAIAEEATDIVLAVWSHTGALIPADTWKPVLIQALNQHVGAALNPSLKSLIAADTLASYIAAGIDVNSNAPLIKMALTMPTLPPINLAPAKPQRMPGVIHAPQAAKRMEDFIKNRGMKQSDFAGFAQTTERTLLRFRRTGKVRSVILNGIAEAMKMSREDLLAPASTLLSE